MKALKTGRKRATYSASPCLANLLGHVNQTPCNNHMPTQDPPARGKKKKKKKLQRRRQGPDRNNTKHKNAHSTAECTGIVLDSKRYFLLSLSVYQVLSFARLLQRRREREREKTKSAERPGREKMYCTFLRTRCIDCHTSVPEKRHCARESERRWALCFPRSPKRERGTSWEPRHLQTGIAAAPPRR